MSRYGRNQDAERDGRGQVQNYESRQEDKRSTTEILQGARRDANQAIDVGETTNQELSAQGEQMDRMGRKLDNIEADLTVSDKILKNMTGFGGMIRGIFSKKPEAVKQSVDQSATPSGQAKTAPDGTAMPQGRGNATRGGANARRGNAGDDADGDKKGNFGFSKEEDDLLDGLCDDIGKLKNIAMVQNQALKEHDSKLDMLDTKTGAVADHTAKTNAKVKSRLS